MLDKKTTVNELKEKVKKFISERDWEQFHTAKNLAMAVSAEAAELMEFFIWADDNMLKNIVEKNRKEIENEVADVAFALLDFCMLTNIDLTKAMEEKLILNAIKYPIEKAKGNPEKYDKL